MEFWGAEVKSGESLKVRSVDDKILHLSQANIGERKREKGNEIVRLFVNVDGKKLVLATLFTDKLPQQQFDLVFDKDFELSHNWKSGSVNFYGYKANNPFEEDFAATPSSGDEFDDSESEEDIPLNLPNHAKHESKANEQKSAEAAKEKKSDAGKHKVLTPEIKTDKSDGDSSQDDDEDDLEDGDDSGEDSDESEEVTPKNALDEDDSSDDSDESEDDTPKKVETSKKRPVESATKTPVADKKAKATPQKTDGKKGNVHVDTPYPSKPAGKTAKPNHQSGGSHTCESCNRTFGSEKGLESHSKAKHGSGK